MFPLIRILKPKTIVAIMREVGNTAVFKIDPARMEKVLSPELLKLVDVFRKHRHEIRIAGGAVRDLLSQEKIPEDVDLATTATPTEMKEMFLAEGIRMINDQGEKHGTITARIDDKDNFEVTTLRIDKITDGRHAEVEFTTDWKIDAERRDLTINSMFLDMDGTVVDFFNGREDMKNQRVAFVGCADRRIKEDYLRILRYFRFFGRIARPDQIHEEATLEAIRTNAAGLERISGERIWMEWKKILAGPKGGSLTLKMLELGLGPYIGLPENANVDALAAFCDRNIQGILPVTLLVQLLRTEEEMNQLNLRLKMSAFERDLGFFVIKHRASPLDLKFWKRNLMFAKSKQAHVREWSEQALLSMQGGEMILGDFVSWDPPRFPIGGKDLKDAGVPPGKLLGRYLELLKAVWFESDFSYDKEQLLSIELPKLMDNASTLSVK